MANHMVTFTAVRYAIPVILCAGIAAATTQSSPLADQTPAPAAAGSTDRFNDSHFHLTNYIQEGTGVRKYVDIMGARVGRSTLFGIPLQQTWDYGNTGDFAPTYYLQTDAPLYYYSFTDAFIAMAYRSLTAQQQARLDPMITGFNPTDIHRGTDARLRLYQDQLAAGGRSRHAAVLDRREREGPRHDGGDARRRREEPGHGEDGAGRG